MGRGKKRGEGERGRSSDAGVFIVLFFGDVRVRRLFRSFQLGMKEPENTGRQRDKVLLA